MHVYSNLTEIRRGNPFVALVSTPSLCGQFDLSPWPSAGGQNYFGWVRGDFLGLLIVLSHKNWLYFSPRVEKLAAMGVGEFSRTKMREKIGLY